MSNILERRIVLDSSDSAVLDKEYQLMITESENYNLSDVVIDSSKYVIDQDTGYLFVDAIVSKAGVYNYAGIGSVAKLPIDLYSKTSLDSLKGLEIVVEHPNTQSKLLDSSTAKYYTVGHAIGDPIVIDSLGIKIKLKITDKDAVSQVLEGSKKWISLGSKADWIINEGVFDSKEYQVQQKNFRHNHIALTSNPRVASSVVILDSLEKGKIKKMALVKLKEGLSVEIDDSKAIILDSFVSEVNAKIGTLAQENETLTKKVGTLDAQIASLDSKDEVEKKIKEGVKARFELINKVSKIAKKVSLDSFDEKQIVIDSIKEFRPNMVLSKPDDIVYLNAVLDTLVSENDNKPQAVVENNSNAGVLDIRALTGVDVSLDSKSSDIDPVEEARNKMIARNQTFWKVKGDK